MEIPQAGALTAPAGSEALSVTLGEVQVAGGFPEVAGETDAIVARLSGHQVTLREVYAAASKIEAAHARAGYVLARVSVPPQELRDGGPLRIVVTDGFIEAVDVSGVPSRVRGAVRTRAGKLQGRPHLRYKDIEESLLIANDVPGLTLRSTLMRGTESGGTRLVLEGTHRPVSGEIGMENNFDPTLGTYAGHAELALNSALGMGEQIYGFVASGYDITRLFDKDVKVRVAGGGIVLPLGDGHLSINPEATFARTRPERFPGAPQSVGLLRRLTIRANLMLVKTRSQEGGLGLTVEQIDEVSKVPDFGFRISHDRYMVARLRGVWSSQHANGGKLGLAAQLSQGLGNLGAISFHRAAASGIPFSRQGAHTSFTRLRAEALARLPLTRTIEFTAQAKGQSTFGRPVFRSEQFALEGPDGLSAYVGGNTTIDEGIAGRFELGTRTVARSGKAVIELKPYVFAAGGTGRIDAPTIFEPGSIKAGNVGVGVRASLAPLGLTLSVEYARGFSDYVPLDKSDRVNVALAFRL